jgi:hypothetical protein
LAYVEFGPDDTGEESHLYPAQIWFFVNLLKPIEISDEYGEGVEDIQYEMIGFHVDGLYAVVTPTDALPVTLVTSNIPTASRTSAAQKDKTKICATSLILKTACHDKKLWLVPVEAISAPALVLDHPGTHSSDRRSLIVVSVGKEMPISRMVIAVPNTTVVVLDYLIEMRKDLVRCLLVTCLLHLGGTFLVRVRFFENPSFVCVTSPNTLLWCPPFSLDGTKLYIVLFPLLGLSSVPFVGLSV